MTQIGQALAGHPPDGLVIAAFALILMGLLTKTSIVPFHFWLTDAHAATVLTGANVAHPTAPAPAEDTAITVTDVGTDAASLALAPVSLYGRRLPLLRRGC